MAIASTNMQSTGRVEVKTPQVADAYLQPFIQPNFDPADYLNSTLPSLAINTAPRENNDRVPLAELSTRTQTLMSQLNALTSRLSNTLTQLTDEILRSGSRLAYEVEVLRGETIGLSDTLNDTLRDDISSFNTQTKATGAVLGEAQEEGSISEPDYIRQLRTLALVRSRLDSVIKVFGDAMKWPLAPSELSMTAGLISVSAPDGGKEDSRSREAKGKDAVQALRAEIAELLESAATTEQGVVAAGDRVNELRALGEIWKGTVEERPRLRLIDGLAKVVEEENKKIGRRAEGRRQVGSSPGGRDLRYGSSQDPTPQGNEGGYGFINNLKRFKGDIYLE